MEVTDMANGNEAQEQQAINEINRTLEASHAPDTLAVTQWEGGGALDGAAFHRASESWPG